MAQHEIIGTDVMKDQRAAHLMSWSQCRVARIAVPVVKAMMLTSPAPWAIILLSGPRVSRKTVNKSQGQEGPMVGCMA